MYNHESHHIKLHKIKATTLQQYKILTRRVVTPWNGLLAEVSATPVNSFNPRPCAAFYSVEELCVGGGGGPTAPHPLPSCSAP